MDQPVPLLQNVSQEVLVMALAAAAILVLLFVVLLVLLLRKRKSQPLPPSIDWRIDVTKLPSGGPPAAGPRLKIFGTPVRLAVVVLAAAGRNGVLPEAVALPAVLNDLAPGMDAVFHSHQPQMIPWPNQLSAQGFVQAFFNHAALPGERGKGTVWCSLAGRFESGQQQFLVGLVCQSERPNSLSQIPVLHVGQWLEVLRVAG